MTTEERLAEIEARANAATPGPWQIGVSIDRTYGSWPVFRLLDMVGPTAAEEKADAVFIENARSDIPWLIARVRELEAQAALDADVRAAADDLLTILKFQGNNHRRVLDLVDALAARKEEGDANHS